MKLSDIGITDNMLKKGFSDKAIQKIKNVFKDINLSTFLSIQTKRKTIVPNLPTEHWRFSFVQVNSENWSIMSSGTCYGEIIQCAGAGKDDAYCFLAKPRTLWDKETLTEIIKLIEQLNKENNNDMS